MVKIETLIEQTLFLLDTQKLAQQDCIALFNDLLSVVQKKLGQGSGATEDVEALKRVYNLISEQIKNIQDDTQSDIDFLTEQLHALQDLQAMSDPAKAKEILNTLLDENEEIKDTPSFKKEITEEATISKQNLVTVINDLKEAINEGSAADVAIYLESLLEEAGEEEEEYEEFGDDDDCQTECACNDSKNKRRMRTCDDCNDCGSKGDDCVDIFSSVFSQGKKPDNSSKK